MLVSNNVDHRQLFADLRAVIVDEIHAFAGDDRVIVATSVLELGMDVGDLDRVIQIDSPPTVSSFLQRSREFDGTCWTER